MNFRKAFISAFAIFSISSCSTTPELQEASRPSPKTPSQITGADYRACVDAKKWAKTDEVLPFGIFSTPETYDFALTMHQKSKKLAEYALRIRAYKVSYISRAFLFGTKIPRALVCYYELKDGSLRYLTHIAPDDRNRVDAGLYLGRVYDAAAIMDGKVVSNDRLWGIFGE